MKKLVRLALRFFAVLAISAIGVIILVLAAPYQGFPGETFVRIERGIGTTGIAQTLAGNGIIRFPWAFLMMRALRPSAKLQAGEYRFTGPDSVRDIFDRIARGDVYYFEFTVPEGSSMFDIAHSLEAQNVMSAADFLEAASDPAAIHDLDASAPNLEGYLFPSTYRLSHGVTAHGLSKEMTDQFRKEWKKLAADKTADVHKAVTLASMVEKETGVAAERPLVAGVFVNRLAKGMHLDCDPTTIYAALLENHYRGKIHRSDLASSNPYNTYQNAGLPPGPISNPGAEAIAAAITPAATDYLYFVAKVSGGGHQFSSSLADHDKAVQQYRRSTKNHAKATGKKG